MPKVKDESRRALTDDEMWHLLERSAEGESGKRDSAIVWTLLGCGLRREELARLRLGDVDLSERRLHIRAATTKSVHARDVNLPLETLKALDSYIADYRKGDDQPEDALFTDRRGRALTGNAVRKLFERLEARTGIRGLCPHMLAPHLGDQLPPLPLRHAFRSHGRGRMDYRTDGGAIHEGAPVRGTSQGALTVHRVTRCAKGKAAVREEATTEEKRPVRKAHRVER